MVNSDKFLATALLSVVLSIPTTVNSALVSVDWQNSGDNLITRDTSSELDWLDLTETNDMSYDYVSSQLGVGGQFYGWRYATDAEVTDLWAGFNIDVSSDSTFITSGLNPNIVVASSILGNILPEHALYNPYGTLGFTASSNNAGEHSWLGMYYYNVTDVTYSNHVGKYYMATDRAEPHTGSYLVQVSAVPVPAAVWLFSSGLIGLIGFTKRKPS